MSGLRQFWFMTALVLLLMGAADLVGDFASAAMSDETANVQTCGGPGDECYCCCGHYEVPIPPVVLPEQSAELYEALPVVSPVSIQPAPLYRPPRA